MKPLGSEPALTEKVRDAIVDAILAGDYRSGERLAQEELADRLGVSRQPVSHALNLLKEQGILVAFGRKGLTVAPMDPRLVEQLYELRGPLEALAARLAAERVARGEIAARDLGELGRLVARFADAEDAAAAGREPSADLAERINADMGFHVGLYRLSGNPFIETVTRAHWVHFRRSMHAVLTRAGTPPPAWKQHRQILDAVRSGDAGEAERLSLDHTRQAAAKAAAILTDETTAA